MASQRIFSHVHLFEFKRFIVCGYYWAICFLFAKRPYLIKRAVLYQLPVEWEREREGKKAKVSWEAAAFYFARHHWHATLIFLFVWIYNLFSIAHSLVLITPFATLATLAKKLAQSTLLVQPLFCLPVKTLVQIFSPIIFELFSVEEHQH